jgi:hypothetical protein
MARRDFCGGGTLGEENFLYKVFFPQTPIFQKFLAGGRGKYIQAKSRAKKELVLSWRRCYSSICLSSSHYPIKVFRKGGLGEKLFSKKVFPPTFPP